MKGQRFLSRFDRKKKKRKKVCTKNKFRYIMYTENYIMWQGGTLWN